MRKQLHPKNDVIAKSRFAATKQPPVYKEIAWGFALATTLETKNNYQTYIFQYKENIP